MIVNEKIQFEDKEIDDKVRRYGVRKIAKMLQISPSYITSVLNGYPISKSRYDEIIKIVK